LWWALLVVMLKASLYRNESWAETIVTSGFGMAMGWLIGGAF
jgi:hypothetical protein